MGRPGIIAAIVATILLLTATVRAGVAVEQTFDAGIGYYTVAVTVTNDTADADLWAVDIASIGMVPGIPPENWYVAQFDVGAFAWVSGLVGVPPVGSDVPPGGVLQIVFQRYNAPVDVVDYTLQFTNVRGDTQQSGSLAVPGPGALAVVGVGMAGMLCRRKGRAE